MGLVILLSIAVLLSIIFLYCFIKRYRGRTEDRLFYIIGTIFVCICIVALLVFIAVLNMAGFGNG